MTRHDSMARLHGTKPCASRDCSGRVEYLDREAEYIKISYYPGGDELTRPIYYHTECAPFGSTRIPEELEIDG